MENDSRVKIPQEFVGSFKYLLNMSEEKIKGFINALREVPIEISLTKLARSASSKTDIPIEDTKGILGMLMSLFTFINEEAVSVANVIEDLKISVEEYDLTYDTKKWKFIGEQLEKLFEEKDGTLSIINKALRLMCEYENIFIRSRVLTDMRPVFKTNIEEGPAVVVILHSLKLMYRKEREINNFFITLDSDDLDILINTLERAKKKAKLLHDTLNEKGLRYIEYSETD